MSSRMPLGRAHLLAQTFSRETRRAGVGVDAWTPLGSLRRFAADVGDVSLLGVVPRSRHAATLDALAALPSIAAVAARTPETITIAFARGTVTAVLAAPEQAGAALVWHTGSRAHVDLLQRRARRMGLTFDAGALAGTGGPIDTVTEEAFYVALSLPFVPPELREGQHELPAAEAGRLPDLLTVGHIRGDLHVHSTWSDGRDSIADMLAAAAQLGYEYVAITDHSERAWSSRRLAAADVPRQRAEIDALRPLFPSLDVLHGVEVDIMPDGGLDFSDDLLAGFDLVLASLHDHAGQDGDTLTRRYLRAIEHPLVSVITHPANRAPAVHTGYDVDFDRLFEAAAATGTAMEVDGAPGHLDMDGALARRAALAGVTIVVDSDCHRADALARQMRFGVGTARRGWIEPRQVLNTRGAAEVRAFAERKRARR